MKICSPINSKTSAELLYILGKTGRYQKATCNKRYNIKEDNLLNIKNLNEFVATSTEIFYQPDLNSHEGKSGLTEPKGLIKCSSVQKTSIVF